MESDVGERSPDGVVNTSKRGEKTPGRCPESAVEEGEAKVVGKRVCPGQVGAVSVVEKEELSLLS